MEDSWTIFDNTYVSIELQIAWTLCWCLGDCSSAHPIPAVAGMAQLFAGELVNTH